MLPRSHFNMAVVNRMRLDVACVAGTGEIMRYDGPSTTAACGCPGRPIRPVFCAVS